MALARTDLSAVVPIGAAVSTAVYTVGAGQTVFIKSVLIHSLDQNSSQNVSIHVVPNAGIALTTNQIARIGIGTDDTFFFEPAYPIVLTKTGDTLQIGNEGTAANSLNVYVTGDIDL